jgi:D-alanyl-D-alanine carboxypeptidase
MRSFATLFLIVLTLSFSSTLYAQESAVFLRQHPLNEAEMAPGLSPVETPSRLPMELYAGMQPLNIDSTLGTRIMKAMNATYAGVKTLDKHGAAASLIVNGAPQWSGAVGMSNSQVSMTPDLAFEIASCSKTFTAALIMKLQDEGKLSIKDSLHKWLPKYPNIDTNITIEQLLNHSSGIFDFFNDDTNGTVIYDEYVLDPTHVWTPLEILDSFVGPPNFKAGTSYRYSNTNFLLLGLIAEKAGNADLGLQIHQNFIDPLGLTHTFFGGEDNITIPFVDNWTLTDTARMSDFGSLDKTAQLTGARGLGNIVSTPGDLVRWARALYTGQVVSAASLKQMLTMHIWPDGSKYGLGTQFAPFGTRSLYGHTGHLIGFVTEMFVNPKDSVSVVCYANSDDPADAENNSYAIDILNAVYSAPTSSVSTTAVWAQVPVSVYPSPSVGHTNIAFRLDHSSAVVVKLYDQLGREVQTILNEELGQGVHIANFDATSLRTGNYFYRIETWSGVTQGKILVQH